MYRCCTLVVVVVVCFVPAYSSSSFLDSAVRPLLHGGGERRHARRAFLQPFCFPHAQSRKWLTINWFSTTL